MKVLLWLSIVPGERGLYGSGDLWRREITTGCVPLVGDPVYLWATDEDGDCGGPRLPTRLRFMGSGGQWHAELAHLLVDPPEPVRQQAVARFANRGDQHDFHIWWTSTDGPVDEAALAAAGWVKQ